MQNIINFLRGSIRITVLCTYPERFMNLCAQNSVSFWDLVRVSKTEIQITTDLKSYKKIREITKNTEFEVKTSSKKGVPNFLWRIRKRYALLIGMLVFLIAVWSLNLFIWDIEVTGNETISASQILIALEETGIGVGSMGINLKAEAIRNEILYRIPELSWFSINVTGSRAVVAVRERTPRPVIVDESVPTKIIASKTGIIEKMIVYEGKSLRSVGDTVMKGEEIATGAMDSLSSGTRYVHAIADVYAKIWYEHAMQMPLKHIEKRYTDNNIAKKSVIIANSHINLYFNASISMEEYDKIVESREITLPGGSELPIKLVTQTYREYEKVYNEMDAAEAEEILKTELLQWLSEQIGDGEALKTDFTVSIENGLITVTLQAECLEQIAVSVELNEGEILPPA